MAVGTLWGRKRPLKSITVVRKTAAELSGKPPEREHLITAAALITLFFLEGGVSLRHAAYVAGISRRAAKTTMGTAEIDITLGYYEDSHIIFTAYSWLN